MNNNKFAAIVFACLILCLGCKKINFNLFGGDDYEKMASELIYDGMENYKDGDYKDALENFQKLQDMYPFHKHAILAELKEADSYYQLGKYDDAVMVYEEFETLHPKNEAIPYVVYQQGLCHFEQIKTPDREQASAYKAIEIFERVKSDYPDTEYGKKADNLIMQCLKSIASHELYVGKFYFKAKNYKAALNRLKRVISNFPDKGTHHEAMLYITECENKLKEETLKNNKKEQK
jgi:outer membrane protein assembly factor BamD